MRRSSSNGWVDLGGWDSLDIAKKQIKIKESRNHLFHHQIIDEKDNVVYKQNT